MNRYLLFAGELYYPHGGMLDLKKDFTELQDALDYLKDWVFVADEIKDPWEYGVWWYVFDIQTSEIVAGSELDKQVEYFNNYR